MKIFLFKIGLSFFAIALVFSCKNKQNEAQDEVVASDTLTAPLFTLLSPEKTKVHFQNVLSEGLNTNILMYEYFYNGGGVATADFNGDGLIDLYFTSNMGDNKFYLNEGKMQFKDITAISKAAGRPGPWKTGISIVDINGDGKLDLYLCYSGALPDQKRVNQLFVNKGNTKEGIPVFEDQASAYGLASPGFSNQAYFFDYDKDDDLDMILLNHNPKSLPILNEVSTAKMLKTDDPLRGLRLFKQQNGKFTDVTVASGINGSALSYGLGVGVSDFNNDGWTDFYVSNDYSVPDYLYINQGDGTFKDDFGQQLGHSSQFSMGSDMVDINNDGLQDIFTLDMLPEDNKRQKLLMAPDNYSKFDLNVRSGFHHQYMRNMLHINNGNNSFSEIGQVAGISNTDWSWAPLLADLDNDGFKDLYVTNGYFRDYTNRDFIDYMDNYVQQKGLIKRQDVLEIIKNMPASNVVNYVYHNDGTMKFTKKNSAWGMNYASNSNGAAYADLDNDGDLDLVVNNINQDAFIYENNSISKEHHYLQVQLQGQGMNSLGIGAKVTVFSNGQQQKLEQMTARGYLSSISPILHFGLGKVVSIDSLKVEWNNNTTEVLKNVKVDQQIVLSQENASIKKSKQYQPNTLAQEIASGIDYKSLEHSTNDFKRQTLLIHQMSFTGPCMVKGDVDKDGLEDVYVGGVKGQSGAVFLQQKNGSFRKRSIMALEMDADKEDSDAVIFDANGDGNADIFVSSGGYYEFSEGDKQLQDRLYLGNGQGDFIKSDKSIPELFGSTSAIAVGDVNGDKSLDIFIGGRVVPGRYPETPRSYLLINDGQGNFTEQLDQWSPELKSAGMVTDAVWVDMNGDNTKELVVVGEWMPIMVFAIEGKQLKNVSNKYFKENFRGWWNTIEIADFNKDGKPDFVFGNMGVNTQFKVSQKEPAVIYYGDFDQNGSVDPLFTYYINGSSYPYVTRDELLGQLAHLRSKFNSYESYSSAKIEDILDQKQRSEANKLVAEHMETMLFLSTAQGIYNQEPLPIEAQYSPIYTISVMDVNKDGNEDMMLFGNNLTSKLRLGRFDANYGMLFLGDGKGSFKYIDQKDSGFNVRGAVRSAVQIQNTIFIGVNQDNIKAYRF